MDFLKTAETLLVEYGPNLLSALLIIVLGTYGCKLIKSLMVRIMNRYNYDHTAVSFISQTLYYMILIGVYISALQHVGVPTSSFVAAIGAMGLAIGLALQGNLANFAAGILILLFKPFKAGNFISVGNVEGSVRSIQMLNTTIITKDNKTIFIPNSKLTSDNVINYNYMPTRFILFTFSISYDNNHHEAIHLLKEIFAKDSRVLNTQNMEIGIRHFGENSVDISAIPLVKAADYWPVYYDTMSAVKDSFDANGISIPYPQRVVYVQSLKEGDSNVVAFGGADSQSEAEEAFQGEGEN